MSHQYHCRDALETRQDFNLSNCTIIISHRSLMQVTSAIFLLPAPTTSSSLHQPHKFYLVYFQLRNLVNLHQPRTSDSLSHQYHCRDALETRDLTFPTVGTVGYTRISHRFLMQVTSAISLLPARTTSSSLHQPRNPKGPVHPDLYI